ncbi:hypothetical protein [Roseivirga pacifica]|uniref:hypothetical protein n=1 Tax=Roseivirga pacifica TaxID=1267423 RepID=UPI00227D3F9E|nr:hypothetical protein [Roseivirga pacifica]
MGLGYLFSRKQEAGSRKQEAGSRKQEAGSRKQEAGVGMVCYVFGAPYVRKDLNRKCINRKKPRAGLFSSSTLKY